MSRREAALTPVLVFTTCVGAIISSVGAPLITTISEDMHVSLASAQWTLTVTLLVGAVSSPIMGRLGDGSHRRETMILGLVAVTLGGLVAALATNLGVLLVGRALQGIALGLIPLTMAAARDHLPRERAASTIALLSVCTAAGTGVGYPLSGLIEHGLGLSAAYWFSAIVTSIALVAVIAVLPRSTVGVASPLDLAGAALLGFGLATLLLAIGQGNVWGGRSPAVIALLGSSAIMLAFWVYQQLRTKAPLVQLRLLRHPAVLTADACAIVLGIALYLFLSVVSELVQAPKDPGNGLSASVLVAGVALVPLSITSVAVSRMLPWLTARLGERSLLPLGCLAVAASGAFFAASHTALWQAFAMMALVGVGIGLTSAVIPGLIVRAVPASETGSALGFYQVVRYVGFSLGSALTGQVLATHTPSGGQFPTESGYLVVLWVGTGICVLAAALAWGLQSSAGAAEDLASELAVENAELGPTGLVGLPDDLR